MADDTRQSTEREISIRDFNANPENKAFAGEQWKEAKDKYYKPPQNANVLAGGTENTNSFGMAISHIEAKQLVFGAEKNSAASYYINP